jgi:murein DD-endopeptidase MepM/ murein hydrolase activator NlpD
MKILKKMVYVGKFFFSKAAADSASFSEFLFFYGKKKFTGFFSFFEKEKNVLVHFFMLKRGRYNRTFLHFATISLLGLGVIIAPVLADTFPIFSTQAQVERLPSPNSVNQSIAVDENVFQTRATDNHRDKDITYIVEKGDTLSSIAQKFDISTDTIKWANSLNSDAVSVGDQLKILPVTGVEVKVGSGDTVYSIAKKYDTNAQKIVDFPFNDFANPETFSLVGGQSLIVPDGVQPSAQPSYHVSQFIASAPTQVTFTGGGFHWPIQGLITQGFSWFHNGIDIAGAVGTPIYAAKDGTVVESSCGWNGGYGCHVLLSHGSGWYTIYAHMVTQPSVSLGQSVGAGELIGFRGSTGNSTGPHTHFEIRSPNGNLNPLSYLQ